MKTKLRKKKQETPSGSSESSDDSSDNSNSSSSSGVVTKKAIKRKFSKTSSHSDSQSSDASVQNNKHKSKSKKQSKRKRDSSTSSSESDRDADKLKKKKHHEKANPKQMQHLEKEDNSHNKTKDRKLENESRLKTSRHELESSKWDSPIDKISDKNRSVKSHTDDASNRRNRSVSRERSNQVREWDRGKEREPNRSHRDERDERTRKYDDRNERGRPYDNKPEGNRNYNRNDERNRLEYDRSRDNGKRFNEDRPRERYEDLNRSGHRKDSGDYERGNKKPRDEDDHPRKNDRRRDDDRRYEERNAGNDRRDRSRSQDRNSRRVRFRNDRRFDNRRRSPKEENYQWGKPGQSKQNDKKPPVEKEKPNFGLSGKLTEDVMTYKGVVIKYSEPPEARKPKRRWRLYPFKGEKAMQTLYIHRESAYLLGRERKVVDLPLDHPSCSKQHAALQYRLVPFERENGTTGKRVRPYIIDLDSANGTFVNNVKVEPRKYVELLEKDVLKFGYSTREYVLLHENSKDEAQDDDVVGDEEEEKDIKPKIKKEKLEPMEAILPQEVSIG